MSESRQSPSSLLASTSQSTPCVHRLHYLDWDAGRSLVDALLSLKMGTLREFQLYMVSLQTWHLA
jgi:hypothetical protein